MIFYDHKDHDVTLHEDRGESVVTLHYQRGVRHIFVNHYATLDKTIVSFQYDDTGFSTISADIEMNEKYQLPAKELHKRMTDFF